MTRSSPDDPVDRLRAADPAAGQPAPDHESIRAAVTARLVDGPAVPAPASATPADELTTRRRRPVLRYAAAAVGAVLFLGAGYGLGSNAAAPSTESVAGPAADSAADEDAAGSDAAPQAAPEIGTAPQTVPGRVGAEGPAGDVELRTWPGAERVVFTAGDLGTGPAQARVWGLDGGGDDAEERAGQLAEALGLRGAPQDQGGTWTVGSEDGSGPVLYVYADGSISYTDPALQPWLCLPVEPLTEPGSSAETAPGSGPAVAPDSGAGSSGSVDCSDADVPAPPDADDQLAAVLTAAGLDPASYALQTTDAGAGATVTATLVLDGQHTDVTLSATVVPDGIASLWGSIARPYDLGEYALISPEEAVHRLADRRFCTSLSGVVAVPDPRFAVSSSGVVAVPDTRFSGSASGDASTSSPESPSAPTERLDPGSSIPWPVRHVQITTAELTLASVPTSAGVLLVPAYALAGTDSDGNEGTWTVPAPTEEAFDFTG